MKSRLVRFKTSQRITWVTDLFDTTPSRANFLTAVAFSNSVRLIPADNKNTAVFANIISLRKITNTSLTEVIAVSTTNLCHERNVVTLNVIKSFVCRPEIDPKYFDELTPETKSQARHYSCTGFFLRFRFGDRKEILRDRLEEFERPFSIDVISGHYILRDRWKNLRDRFGPSKHLKKHCSCTMSKVSF